MLVDVVLRSHLLLRACCCVSHEIRTPANAIIGATQLLRSYMMDADQRDLVDTVWNGSKHLLTIINDILDFSKIESGQLQLDLNWSELQRTLAAMGGCVEQL